MQGRDASQHTLIPLLANMLSDHTVNILVSILVSKLLDHA